MCPSILLFMLTWSLAVGDVDVLPVWAVVASFVLQAHLAVLALGGFVALCGLVGLAVSLRRRRHRSSPAAWVRLRARLVRRGAVAAGVLIVVWLPVLADEVSGTGNLGSILRRFGGSSDDETRGIGFAIDRAVLALGPRPLFARRIDPFGLDHLQSVQLPGRVVAVGLVLAASALLARSYRRGQGGMVGLLATALLVMTAGVLTAVGLPFQAALKQANLRWMWTAGMFMWLAVSWAAWTCLNERIHAWPPATACPCWRSWRRSWWLSPSPRSTSVRIGAAASSPPSGTSNGVCAGCRGIATSSRCRGSRRCRSLRAC